VAWRFQDTKRGFAVVVLIEEIFALHCCNIDRGV